MFTYVTLRVLHVACVATWFGAPLGMPSAVKRAIRKGPEAARAAAAEANRTGRIAAIFGVLTLVTGLVLIFDLGGFGAITKNFHMALGLVVVMLVVELGLVAPTAVKLAARVDEADFAAGDERALALVKRLSMGAGILQLLWVVVLVFMFWRF